MRFDRWLIAHRPVSMYQGGSLPREVALFTVARDQQATPTTPNSQPPVGRKGRTTRARGRGRRWRRGRRHGRTSGWFSATRESQSADQRDQNDYREASEHS